MTTTPQDASATKKPRRKLTLTDRIAVLDKSITAHQLKLTQLANRRAKLVEEQRVAAEALMREAQQAARATSVDAH